MAAAAATARLDQWLWAARLFKSRASAVAAIRAGRLSVNGSRAKPARAVQIGDLLIVTRNGIHFELTVRALTIRRRGAALAETLYHESAASQVRRTAQAAALRAQRNAFAANRGRPSKRARRALEQFKRSEP